MSTANQDIQAYLIERCLKKDRKAQYQLYTMYADAMYNICMRFMKDADIAQDVLQEAFIDAFTKLKSFRGDAFFGAWLKRIVINRCISTLQKRKALTVSLEEAGSAREAADEPDFDEKFDPKSADVAKVMQAIEQLPEGCRVVLNLYLFEGYDHAEIAEILGVKVTTSKAQYSKARKRLRKLLENEKFDFYER